MENKKKRRRLFFFPLCFSFILLITTTYAWFSANRVVSINSLDVHIQADGVIEVSTDSVNCNQVITVDDIKNANKSYPSSVNQIPYRIYPVSTGGDITNGFLNMYKGEATNTSSTDFILVANKSEETESFGEESNGTFIAFDLFFKIQAPKELYLSSSSKVSYIGDKEAGIENATRVAILNEGSADNEASARSLKNAREAVIWEPNYDTHTEYGVSNALKTYGIATSQTGGSLIPYDGVTSDITSNDNVLIQNANRKNFQNLYKRINVNTSTHKNYMTNNKIKKLNPAITK